MQEISWDSPLRHLPVEVVISIHIDKLFVEDEEFGPTTIGSNSLRKKQMEKKRESAMAEVDRADLASVLKQDF